MTDATPRTPLSAEQDVSAAVPDEDILKNLDMDDPVHRGIRALARLRWPEMTVEDFADLPKPIVDDLEREAGFLIGEVYPGLLAMGLVNILQHSLTLEAIPDDASEDFRNGVRETREFLAYQVKVLRDLWSGEE